MTDQFKDLTKRQELLDSVQRPVSCFVTFENEEGKCRADEYNSIVASIPEYQHFQHLLGQPFKIQQAPEPSDILWENRHYTKNQRGFRSYLACLILLAILFASFVFIFYGTYKWQQLIDRYPIQDCKRVEKKYEGRLRDFHKDSWDEYVYN